MCYCVLLKPTGSCWPNVCKNNTNKWYRFSPVLILSIDLPLYCNPWLTVCTVISLNFDVCFGDMEDLADLWPLFILCLVYCNLITSFYFRFSAVKWTLQLFFLCSRISRYCCHYRSWNHWVLIFQLTLASVTGHGGHRFLDCGEAPKNQFDGW